MIDRGKRISDTVFCAIDLETTGVNPSLHRIVEAGLVRFSVDGVIETYESLVNPGVPIPEEVIRIHGITNDMVALSPSIGQIIGGVKNFIGNALPVIHNPAFDLAFIDRFYRDFNLDTKKLFAFDTVRLAKKAFPLLDNHRLSTLGKHFNVVGANHRALSDANCCMEIFCRVLGHAGPEKMRTIGDLLNYHGALVRPKLRRRTVAAKRCSVLEGLVIGKRARIRYEDNTGNVTVRDIVPLEFINSGKKSYLFAHCLLRREGRYFRTGSILEVL